MDRNVLEGEKREEQKRGEGRERWKKERMK